MLIQLNPAPLAKKQASDAFTHFLYDIKYKHVSVQTEGPVALLEPYLGTHEYKHQQVERDLKLRVHMPSEAVVCIG